MKWVFTVIAVSALLVSGCIAKVTVDKRPNLALPVYCPSSSTNPTEYVIVDQGYKVRYMKFGFNTDIQSMSAEITTNKTVNFQLGGLHSYSTNSITIKMDELLKTIQMLRDTTNATVTVTH